MGTPLSLKNPKVEELQMDWPTVRRAERGERSNHPVVTITRQQAICLIQSYLSR
jgi:hypothetical protein